MWVRGHAGRVAALGFGLALGGALALLGCGGDDKGGVSDTLTPDVRDDATSTDISDGMASDASATDGASSDGTATDATDDVADGDTGSGDASEDADADIAPGTFGAACNENNDCLSGWCVTSDAGPVCTRQCTEDCPAGWSCLGIAGEIDITFLCVPRQDRLCQACLIDRQCNNGYCLTFDDGQRCTAACENDDDCPAGYACEMRQSEAVSDERSLQCVPKNDTCACLPGNEGLQEPCNAQNASGTCWGLRTCLGADGWSACTAPTPAREVCDGVDNNCNLFTDENVEGAGSACEVRNELGACRGIEVCRGAAGLECVAPTPAPEACNYEDDDCDGETDEDFADAASGLYLDDQNCGVCGNDCDGFFPNAVSTCRDVAGVARCVVASCADGYYQAGPTTCLPVVDANCLPCTEDSNCVVPGNACVPLDGGHYCAEDCGVGNLNGHPANTCGEGFRCTAVGGKNLCLPKTSSCGCLAESDAGKTRPCTSQTGFGTCAGTQVCDPRSGFSACTARTPSAEVCNGEDDDCDGVFDEGVVEPAQACQRQNEFGTCGGAWSCEGSDGWVCDAKVPQPERCNYIDDDCDGQTDEDFVDAASSSYLTTEDCGICGRDCDEVILFSAETECRLEGGLPTCVALACQPDFYIPPNTDRVCIPTSGAASCSPCADDAQCAELPDGRCTDIDGGRYCTGGCSIETDCDDGYTCLEGRCLPTTLSCSCLPGLGGSLRPCVHQNAFGTCTGFETCDPTRSPGWSGCSARQPASEVCNGQDDNCNGRADENLTHTPSGCASQNAFGTCVASFRCDGADGWQCPVEAAEAEACNYQDDDCDGLIDESFRGEFGKYTDDDNCGACGSSCGGLIPNASAHCVAPTTAAGQPRCEVEQCDPGYYQVGPLTCLPAQDTTCIPCVTDENCPTPGDKCLELDGGHYCGRDCALGNVHGLPAGLCDDGFECHDFGGGVAQCVPFSGSCSCLDGDRNRVRTCSIEGPAGTCFGTEVCAPESGWGGCTAKLPTTEVCNGQDDDCNGRVDEAVAPPVAPCEVKNSAGTCTASWVCGGADGWVCNAATPLAEVCNGQDDDCDGRADEDFRDGAGVYVDLGDCGACGISCVGAIPNATAQCVVHGVSARCEVQSCAPGFYRASDLTCLPASDNTCFACSSDASCPTPGDKCLALDGGSFCGRDCSAGNNHGTPAGQCPTGFGCRDVAGGGKQCVPLSGSCACLAADAGESRACRAQNANGTCFGTETCDPQTGWVGCDAKTPTAEACDGADNDCDGLTDEGVSHEPATCASAVAGVGTCTGTFICGGATGWQCPVATPTVERCDFLDNDCDGQTDEDFRVSGQYVDDQNCGSCGISCEGAIPNATAACAVGPNGQPRCEVATCNSGYYEAGPLSCVSVTSNLCSPCASDADCPTPGDVCLTATGGARYCGQDCSAGNLHGGNAGVCPSGYQCVAVAGAHNQCEPTSGTCDCLPANSGATRTCQVVNGNGTCFGTETCNPGSGWVGCTAKVPAAELCNGLDDNCNSQIDEGVTHAPATCSNSVVGVGTCTATYVCQGAAGWQCPVATPKTETCNAQDDDCDASIDETFKNAQGLYVNLDNCGACGVSCVGAIPNATATCAVSNGQPRCEVASCDAGYYQAGTLTCLQATDNSCAPCSSDANCRTPGDRCLTLDGGKFCGRDCSATNVHGTAAGTCPSGYVCSDLGGGVRQCVPQSGSCSCLSGDSGETRTCIATNASGTCFGTETCNPASGWNGCSARTPSDEDCDGVDDDCDSVVDDVSGRGAACSVSNGFGTCTGVRDCVAGQSTLKCSAATPAAETCNGKDDDCDAATDESFAVGQSCSVGVGACQRFGITVCDALGTGVSCNATAGTPSPEICDNIDNDCDTGQAGGGIDENAAWANKGQPCTQGKGVCQVTGVYVCSGDGQTTVCSQTPPSPAVPTEVGKCNNLDDDCDGAIDEDFATKGQVCSVGVGVCKNFGNYKCNVAGSDVTCDATAGTGTSEACDLLDNDCDGSTDEDFKNAGGSKYDKTTTCGNCFTNCTTIYAGKANAFGTCDATPATPTCVMSCNSGYFNLNAVPDDGCEFKLETNAIYVGVASASAIDDATCGLGPVGTGTGNHPCKSIAQGLARAVAASKTQVLVADGLYAEQVTLRNGVSLLGGYRADTWERHLASTNTTIRGPTVTSGHAKAVVASNITATTVFEGFVVYGGASFGLSGNSYTLWISASTGALTIRNNYLFGGTAGFGDDGGGGDNGVNGGDGQPGERSVQTSSFTSCTSEPNQPGNVSQCFDSSGNLGTTSCGGGGANTCGGGSVSGGNGAGAVCPVFLTQQAAGSSGSALSGNGSAGAGGAGGYPKKASTTCSSINVSGNPTASPGTDGGQGLDGSAGAGCAAASGAVTSSEWVGTSGGIGGAAKAGGGGGGGGAGGGLDANSNCGTGYADALGGSGGGGGAGGCGGTGGNGGAPGGGAFVIFFTNVTTTSNLPVISGNIITRGTGGDGGNGGNGGKGGLGGNGGDGGGVAGNWAEFMGVGGRGGQGGDGGYGGGGGGGCGGVSYAFYLHNFSGTPNYVTANTVLASGDGGAGGAGGASLGAAGTDGTDGVSADANF